VSKTKVKPEIDEDENEDGLEVKKGKTRGRKKSENITQSIEIDDNFRIRLDARNFILQSKYASDNSEDKLDDEEDSKDGWKTLGYYSDVIGCLKGLIKSKTLNEIKLTKKQSVTFQEYYDVLFKVNKETTDMVRIVQNKYDKLSKE
jgi:hypothetical protein